MSNRYHIQVLVKEGGKEKLVWRRIHPTGGDPYVFDKETAEKYVEQWGKQTSPEMYRLEELPD